jgi:Tfp pilus assembly protein FimT
VKGQPGYSILELVIVAGLIGVLMALGSVSLRAALLREETEGWARAVANDLTAAQQAAVTRRTAVTATFLNQTYTITAGTEVIRQETLPSQITFGSTPQTVQFDRRGVPATSITLTMTGSAGRSFQIIVRAGTGRVVVNEL